MLVRTMTQPWNDISSHTVTDGTSRSQLVVRPRLYATSVERKAAWRRRHGMAARPHYPSAATKQAASRARKRQTARDLAARECAVIEQALRTRALADQSWELYELIDAWSRDPDMPHRGPAGRPAGLLVGASTHFYGVAAARVRRYRRALQRLARVRATRRAQVGVLSTASADSAQGCTHIPPQGPGGDPVRGICRERPAKVRMPPGTKLGICHHHTAVCECLALQALLWPMVREVLCHRGVIPGAAPAWTNPSARAMMPVVRHEAIPPSGVSTSGSRWRPWATRQREL